jgi:putative ABC transport system permease protein
MLPRPAVPLAWRNLTENKLRLAASVAGTAFAVTLMLMQTGFRDAMLDSMVAVIRHLDGELFLVSPTLYSLANPRPFPARRLEQARAFEDVSWGGRVYIETQRARWRSPVDGLPHRIRVVAYPPEDDTLDLDALRGARDGWSRPDTAMADVLSKPGKLGRFATPTSSELSGRRVQVVGTFALGTDFQNDGTLVMSEDNFLSVFPDRRSGVAINVGVLRVRAGTDLGRLKEAVRAALPADVLVLTKPEFIAKEHGFWGRVAPIGTIFNIGVVVGFVVGIAICYQVLHADIADRLDEFATLKAMGYSHAQLLRIVVEQAVYLALLGFAAGQALSLLVFSWVHAATGLPMEFKPGIALMVLALTVLMCVLAGAIAARRLVSVDPAQLYQ